MTRARLATVWLDGCSGCHMSFLDLDEELLNVADRAQLVYSPLVDVKEFPVGVDITLVEGAVATDADTEKIKLIRERSKTLVALGDCAVTGNVPAMRNPLGLDAVTAAGYGEELPTVTVPALTEKVLPVHQVVDVDVYLPGCPPSAAIIAGALNDLLSGRSLRADLPTKFGA